MRIASKTPAGPALDQLISLLSKLPGLGPRSAKRVALYLLKRRESVMLPLARALTQTAQAVQACHICGNWDQDDPCTICASTERYDGTICVVPEVADLWALESTGVYQGLYHVLGGVIAPLDGVGPEELNIASLAQRASAAQVHEVVLAVSATVDGQTTAHYISERLSQLDVEVTGLAHGMPVGSELDHLDEGTIAVALKTRRRLS